MSIQTTPLRLGLVVGFIVLALGGLGFSLVHSGMLDWLLVPKTPMASFSQLVEHMPADRRDQAKRVIAAALKEYEAQNNKSAPGYQDGHDAVQLFAGVAVAGDRHGEGVEQRAARQAGMARNAGLRDPLVLAIADGSEYIYGRSRTPGDLEAHVGRVEALLGTGYPSYCFLEPIADALLDMRRFDLKAVPAATDYVTQKKQALLEAAMTTLKELPDAPTGFVVEKARRILNVYRRTPGQFNEVAPLFDAMLVETGASGADLALYRGDVLIAQAWQARGGGYADSVSADGARVFRDRLTEAATIVAAASDQAPDDPRLATMMITAEMGLNKGMESMEGWFTRAVQADPKYADAYDRKMFFIQPRWYGTNDDVIAFARECVKTGYWDANVPPVAIEGISTMASLERALYADKQIWGLLYDTAKTYLSKYPASIRMRTRLVSIAVQAEKWKIAQEQIAILDDNWDRTVMTEGAYNRLVDQTTAALAKK